MWQNVFISKMCKHPSNYTILCGCIAGMWQKLQGLPNNTRTGWICINSCIAMIAHSRRDWQRYSFSINPSGDFMCERLLALVQEKWIPWSKFALTWAFRVALTPRLCSASNKLHQSICLLFSLRTLTVSVELWAHLGFGSASLGKWDGILHAAWEKNVAWDAVYKKSPLAIKSISHHFHMTTIGKMLAEEKKKKKGVGVRDSRRSDKYRTAVTAKWGSHLKGSEIKLVFFFCLWTNKRGQWPSAKKEAFIASKCQLFYEDLDLTA